MKNSRISPEQREVLLAVGHYRVVRIPDLRKYVFGDDDPRCREVLNSLRNRGMIYRAAVLGGWRGAGAPRMIYAVVLKPGAKELTEKLRSDSRPIYAEVVRPRDVEHDAWVFGQVQEKALEIERSGGKVIGAVKEDQIMVELNRARRTGDGSVDEVMERYELREVDGRVPVPDAQVIYEDRSGDMHRCSIEVATANYSRSAVAAKSKAGFSVSKGGAKSSGGSGSLTGGTKSMAGKRGRQTQEHYAI